MYDSRRTPAVGLAVEAEDSIEWPAATGLYRSVPPCWVTLPSIPMYHMIK